jgi:hypothetical protein
MLPVCTCALAVEASAIATSTAAILTICFMKRTS